MPNLLLTMWDTIKSSNIGILVAAGLGMFAIIGGLSMLSYHYTLSGIKSRTVGDGQHGTARWATDKEIRQTYAHVPFKVRDWRKGVSLPTEQGLVLGCKGKKDELTALVDSDDIHCLMIAASGAGKTAFFLYPNLEYACASGMSFLALDTKGDLARNYGSIAKKYYGYKHISVIDLRNPTRSDGNNLLTLINRYMDIARKQPDNLAARAKAEKYAKILAKSIVSPEGNSDHGQNAFFYDAAEGLLSSTILLLAEFLPPDEEHPEERRHIVSVFKLVQDLLAMPSSRGRNGFQLLVDIQAKLAEGKGGGYERWAKKHNLKEMSKTLLFLQEQKISSADELKELADAALSHYHELGDSIKAAEQRMTEIAVLRAHIVNYAKTRPVYDAYRKSGYSSKFLEAHREEITLHKAAKAAFNESGLKKLPKVKDLNAEYSALLTKKKALYPEYRKARDEMQDIVKAQKNVELFFAEEKDSKQVEQIR